jgi:sarcosine oxidase
MERREVVVVGAGVMGLASARSLERAGRDVLVLERFRIGHERGSSHGSSRIFRLSYDDPEWVAMGQESLRLWRELEDASGRELLSLTGSLDAGRDQRALRDALEASGARFELLGSGEADRRFGISLGDGEVLLQPDGGVVWAARALELFAAGPEIREDTRVSRLEPATDGVRLETSAGPIEAGVAVVAAGAWTKPLLATAGIDLPAAVTRETVVYFEHERAGTLPAVVDWNVEEGRHAYSLAAGDGLLKTGLHHSGVPADPDDEGGPDLDVVASVSDWVRRRFPSAGTEPVRTETCLYTSIEDDRFVMQPHGPVVVCSACSGHGFKFAPLIGRRVAELACSARP